MYRLEGIIVILLKLYLTLINSGIVPCIRHTFYLGKLFPLPMELYFLYLGVVTLRSQRYTYNPLFNRNMKKQVMFDKVE
jgi:hypothetical protein